jgi:soluble lytic murein transglycosylase-like protein
MMTQDQLVTLAKTTAQSHNLYVELICAICERESTWNPYEIRFESGWYDRKDWPQLLTQSKYPRFCSVSTEIAARSMSWGLMQTLGQSVREIGFADWMPQLSDPLTGLDWGCQLFARKLELAKGNVPEALLLWNGGANKSYPQEILDLTGKYR